MQRVLVSEFSADLEDPAHMYGVKHYKEIFIGEPYDISVTLCMEPADIFEIAKTSAPRTQRRPGDVFKTDISLYLQELPSGEEKFDKEAWKKDRALVFHEEEIFVRVCKELSKIQKKEEKLKQRKVKVLENIL
nr:hypothetical protein [Marseillevirus cajuinensis]